MAAEFMVQRRATSLLSVLSVLALAALFSPAAFAQDAAAPAPAENATSVAPAAAAAPDAGEPVRHHALSLIGEPKYGPDFKHFDWVNPDAPKGGVVRFATEGTFDSLNPFSIKGVSASGIGMIYDSLMAGSPDEESTEYGLVAEWVSFPPDFAWAKFGLRPEARFHDGEPIKPEDVIFSLEALKKAHPMYARYYKNVVKAEKTGDHEVTFTFDITGNRELPQILGQLTILPKHFWDAKGKNGEPRDITKSTLEVPLGSGSYKIKEFDTGNRIVLERVKDYWAKDLPVVKGQWNFDELRFQYFRDRTAAFEDFKAGRADMWRESTASAWATQFAFPGVQKGWVKKEAIPTKGVARMQGFAFNTRREKLKDPRVREAFNYAFDFEDLNKSVLFGQYTRVGSYFDNSELAAKGLPEGRELEILKEFEKDLPPEVFTKEWKNPVYASREDARKNLAEAMRLFKEAGWEVRQEVVEDPDCGVFCKMGRAVGLGSAKTQTVMRNAKGEPFTVEFLLGSESFTRHVAHYISDLQKIGVQASIRVVDPAQYEQRETNFDFDIVVDSFPQSMSPGNEQRDFWGSAAADQPGSRNTIGIKSPVIDAIIEKLVVAKDRAEVVATTRALDRVLQWGHYVVPQWYNPYEWLATWDMFGRPEKLPSLTSAFTQIWWVDPAKQQALAANRK
ncbi:extracellular solute-binding protein [Hyphomicrobium sp.]|uniref:extracellular solute-binding protein n=1 Tax=Hyphomicrobium sp. TaxID=82 RepID=UPI002E302910|nr:extracellular solute-binding protein [Hyphomicrobium sp.]HEX2841914.1 extracellular solute-binding protein [Hyphomicrobium sp.]